MTPLHDDPFAELGNGRTFIKPTPGAAVWGTSLPSPDEFASMLEGRW